MTATKMSRKKLILGFVSLPLIALGMMLLPQHAASTAAASRAGCAERSGAGVSQRSSFRPDARDAGS